VLGLRLEKTQNSEVTVIIPTLNEEKSIADLIGQLRQMGYGKVLVVDGNSEDRTTRVAKECGADVILQEGRGKGSALRQAFNHSGLEGDIVVMMDADGSMNPKELPRFVETVNLEADIAKGSRFLPDGGSYDMSLLRRIGNGFFLFLVNLFWSTNYTDLCYGYAVFRRNALEELRKDLRASDFEIETEVFIKAAKNGLKVVEVPSKEMRRKYGKSNLNALIDGLRILRTIIVELLTANN
jgi:glycosyltransferase involved in cell wall biosynthesis